MSNLTTSLREAWIRRYRSAETDLAAAESAPGLFKPQFAADAAAQAHRAIEQMSSEVTA